jgi:hypothetical protein
VKGVGIRPTLGRARRSACLAMTRSRRSVSGGSRAPPRAASRIWRSKNRSSAASSVASSSSAAAAISSISGSVPSLPLSCRGPQIEQSSPHIAFPPGLRVAVVADRMASAIPLQAPCQRPAQPGMSGQIAVNERNSRLPAAAAAASRRPEGEGPFASGGQASSRGETGFAGRDPPRRSAGRPAGAGSGIVLLWRVWRLGPPLSLLQR